MNLRDEVINLCFHGIGTPERTLEPDEEQYWVKTGQFEELVAVIRRYPSMRITFDDRNASDVSSGIARKRAFGGLLRDRRAPRPAWVADPGGHPQAYRIRHGSRVPWHAAQAVPSPRR